MLMVLTISIPMATMSSATPSIKNNRDALEDSIRKFVKISSTGFDSEIDIIEREESVNPFDMDDEETIDAPEEAVHDPDANPFDDY